MKSLTFNLQLIPSVIWIIVGFLIFEFSTINLLFEQPDKILKFISLFIIFYFYSKSKKNKIKGLINNLLLVLFIVELLMLFIGFYWTVVYYDPFDGSIRKFIGRWLFFTHSPFTYLIPFASYISFSISDFRWLKKLTIFLTVLYFILLIVHWNGIFKSEILGFTTFEKNDGDFVTTRELVTYVFSGIGLLGLISWNKLYFSKLENFILLISMLFAFVANAVGGGRGGTFIILAYIFVFIFIGEKFVLIKLLAFTPIIFYTFNYIINDLQLFDFLLYRLFEDDTYSTLRASSREDFVKSMVTDFSNNPVSWIFGRGIFGSFRLTTGEYREWMEWGFLYQILKGGIVYLLVYVFILLYSFKKAFFDSNNRMVKSMGILCLFQALELIPFGVPDMTAKYFLVWWFVGVINNKQIRQLDDQYILKQIG
jgi:hypothetical protein